MSGCSQFVANPKLRRNKSAKKCPYYLESTENHPTFALAKTGCTRKQVAAAAAEEKKEEEKK
jgi:hypothetical protein